MKSECPLCDAGNQPKTSTFVQGHVPESRKTHRRRNKTMVVKTPSRDAVLRLSSGIMNTIKKFMKENDHDHKSRPRTLVR